MATITAAEFKAMIQDSDITATNAEYLIDQAINTLNAYGADIANMNGTAGSMTWSGESRDKGKIMDVARMVYYSFYKGVEAVTAGGLTVSVNDILANPTLRQAIKEMARDSAEFDVSVI